MFGRSFLGAFSAVSVLPIGLGRGIRVSGTGAGRAESRAYPAVGNWGCVRDRCCPKGSRGRMGEWSRSGRGGCTQSSIAEECIRECDDEIGQQGLREASIGNG